MHIVANFKMNGSLDFFSTVCKMVNKLDLKDTKLILCPPFVYLPNFKLKNNNVFIGAQDIANSEDGKSTGQINGKMLKEFNVEYCIIGHSERNDLGENLEIVIQKIKEAISNNIIPIICFGEANKQMGFDEVLYTVKSYLKACSGEKIFLAYEPVWSVGTGEILQIETINYVATLIRNEAKNCNVDVTIIYGGSVNDDNFDVLKNAEIDGLLIGGLSNNLEKFSQILKGRECE